MRAYCCVFLSLVALCFLGGCAGERATVMSFFTPKETTPEEAQKRYERAKAKYDRNLSEYESRRTLNAGWREGYGFNNPNPDRIRKGEKPVDFFPQRPRPTPPIPPAASTD
jgi:hypothetical protein